MRAGEQRAPRKIVVRLKGNRRSPMLRLKHLPREARQKLYEAADKLTCEAWRAHVEKVHRIKLNSNSHLTRFRDWQFNQERLETRNDRVEQFELYFRSKNPRATAAELRSASIAFMLNEAAMDGDRKGFNSLARTSISDDSEGRAREEFEFDAAEQCLKHLPVLREIAANNDLDQNAKLAEVRRRLFGTAPS